MRLNRLHSNEHFSDIMLVMTNEYNNEGAFFIERVRENKVPTIAIKDVIQ